MANETPQKQPPKETDKEAKGKDIDRRAHRRSLRFINSAQKPEVLMVAPHDRKLVDEEEAHTDHIEHHQEERQILDREQAEQILDARDEINPLRGFAHVKDAFAINARIAELLRGLFASFGPANY